MKPSSIIGIYSRPTDDHLHRVIQELHRRHLPYLQFDTADFPQQLHLAARLDGEQEGWHGEAILHGTTYHLDDFRSLWYRRPSKTYTFATTLSREGYRYAKAEAQRGFTGLLYSLPCLWVSHPDVIRAAEWKPQQLAFAQQLGLHVPRTLVTNNPGAALQFFEECQGEVIYKAFSQGGPLPKSGEPWQGAVYTTKLTRAALHEHAATLALTMNLLQEYIPICGN